MDPNVQTALVSVLGVTITTVGVVLAAKINNQKERQNAASAGVDAGLDEKDVLSRMLSLISEVERKELEIVSLKEEIRMLKKEVARLKRGGDSGPSGTPP